VSVGLNGLNTGGLEATDDANTVTLQFQVEIS
jgi:hypothetical protein